MAPVPRRLQNLEFVENGFQNEETDGMPRNSESINNYDGQNIAGEDLHNNIYEFHSDGRMKRRRGHTKLADVEGLPEGTKIVVTLDRFNMPISKSAAVLGSYLGTIVRKPHLAPLNILKWRQYKRQLKIKYYKPNLSMERVLQNVPETVEESQWATLVSYWYSDEAKEMSSKNQDNAKNIKHPHTLGRTSTARKRKELEDAHGEEIDRATLFDECHKNKEGAYVNSLTEEKMNQVYMILAEKRLDRDITEEDIEDAMNTAFGKDHSGRVRGMGPTITPSNYYGVRFGNSSTSNNAQGSGNWKETKGFMKFVVSFLQKKFPEENLMSQAPKFLQELAKDYADQSPRNDSFSDGGD